MMAGFSDWAHKLDYKVPFLGSVQDLLEVTPLCGVVTALLMLAV